MTFQWGKEEDNAFVKLKEMFLSAPVVTVEEASTSFSPFSLVDCMLLSHFSFNDFVTVAFLDLARDLDIQI